MKHGILREVGIRLGGEIGVSILVPQGSLDVESAVGSMHAEHTGSGNFSAAVLCESMAHGFDAGVHGEDARHVFARKDGQTGMHPLMLRPRPLTLPKA